MNDGTVMRMKATTRGRVGMSLDVANAMASDDEGGEESMMLDFVFKTGKKKLDNLNEREFS